MSLRAKRSNLHRVSSRWEIASSLALLAMTTNPEMLRVLVVTYYFPPSGGSGVQRMLKTIKYLLEYGVIPEVLTVADGAYPEYDDSLLAEIPPEVAVHRTRSVDPFRLYAVLRGKSRQEAVKVGSVGEGEGFLERIASWIRANVFLPDARVGWVPFAKREAARLIQEKGFDVVLTSGPPHSTHLIGRYLKRKFGIPWVVDFRDPWTEIFYYHDLRMTSLASRIDRRLELSVLAEADHIVTVGPTLAKGLTKRGRRSTADVSVVYNGYDAKDFTGVHALEPPTDRFSLVHVGSLSDSLNPVALWEALAALKNDPAIGATIQVRLVGRVGEKVMQSIQSKGIDDIVEVVGYVEHDEAIREMGRATLLLLSLGGSPASRGIITGKLFEYLASGRPILAVGPKDGDAAQLIENLEAGGVFDWADEEGVRNHLKAIFARWKAGDVPEGAPANRFADFSRAVQAERIAEVLKDVSGERDARSLNT